MKEKSNKTNTYQSDSSIWTGIIELEDFNTNYPNQKRIYNQIEGIEESNQRKERQKYKHMTLEELKKMKIISNTDGRPLSSLTDEAWQKEFNIRKLFITPYSKNIKKLKGSGFPEHGREDEAAQDTYDNRTNWQEYCCYINDVLNNIRSGQIDYCYFIYQIEELLKFHYDHLRTRYCNGYWEVWLD